MYLENKVTDIWIWYYQVLRWEHIEEQLSAFFIMTEIEKLWLTDGTDQPPTVRQMEGVDGKFHYK